MINNSNNTNSMNKKFVTKIQTFQMNQFFMNHLNRNPMMKFIKIIRDKNSFENNNSRMNQTTKSVNINAKKIKSLIIIVNIK